ncbi:uncharacterized protein TrAtP1_004667 [Trichoderma atroviride]|uniref:uncharacterized protein n=1 Tax=Hypocrea atroviridis TaxID=63577 RepID=UPI003332E5DB|nr:hypothetical protein TrAtP1_004667 [Trichoderma atroviride]
MDLLVARVDVYGISRSPYPPYCSPSGTPLHAPKGLVKTSGSGKCSPSNEELRIRALSWPPQSGNRCTSGLEPAAIVVERADPWLARKEDQRPDILSYQFFFTLLLRGIVGARLHHDREDVKAR